MFQRSEMKYQRSAIVFLIIFITLTGGVFALTSTELFQNSYYVINEMRQSNGFYIDALTIEAGWANKPYSVVANGIGLLSLCISDSMYQKTLDSGNWEPNAADSVLKTLQNFNSISTEYRNANGLFHRYFTVGGDTTGKSTWGETGHQFSTQDNAIFAIAVTFCKNYFHKNASIVAEANNLLNSMDFTAAISDGGERMYMILDLDGTPPDPIPNNPHPHTTQPFSEYMLVAWLAKNVDSSHPGYTKSQTYWDTYYKYPFSGNIVIKNYNGIDLFTDNAQGNTADRYLSSFPYQFNYYYVNYFKKNQNYMNFMNNARRADQYWWDNHPSITSATYEWGLGAGEHPVYTQGDKTIWGYLACTIKDDYTHMEGNPIGVVSPHIIAGFIPLQNIKNQCVNDLIDIYNNEPYSIYTIPNTTREVLWRYSKDINFDNEWEAPYIQSVDFSTMLFGLASLPEFLGHDFFSTYNDLDFIPAGTNIALGKTVNSSRALDESYINDGNHYLRWSSFLQDDQYISIDLGQVYNVDRFKIFWEAAYGKKYDIQVSVDTDFGTANWSTVYSVTAGDGGIDDLTIAPTPARHVKIQGIERINPGYTYSIWEFEIYAQSLAAPSDLSASIVSRTQIDLSWNDNADNEDGFIIERKTGTGSYSEITPLAANTTSYSDTDVSACTDYTYRVYAFNAVNNSGYTNEASVTTPGPYMCTPVSIPGIIEVEDFDTGGEGIAYHDTSPGNSGGQYRLGENVDIENCDLGGYDIGWTADGEWLEYTVNVTTAGLYQVALKTASPGATGSIRLQMNRNDITGAIPLFPTGSWQTWQTTTVSNVSLETGLKTIRVEILSSGFNIDNITFNKVPEAPTGLTAHAGSFDQVNLSWEDNSDCETQYIIDRSLTGTGNWIQLATVNSNTTQYTHYPQSLSTLYYRVYANNNGIVSDYSNIANAFRLTIEAEDYQYSCCVDTETCNDIGGGMNVNQIQTNDWMSYYVDIPSSGTYMIAFRVVTIYNGCKIKVDRDVDPRFIKDNIEVYPPGNDWDDWMTITTQVELEAGQYHLGFNAQQGGWNFNWFRIYSVLGKAIPDNENNETETIIPSKFALSQNYPNPFNPVTTIQYNLPEPSFVTLKVYNITGQVVCTLMNAGQQAGSHQVIFDASQLNSGVYFYSFKAGSYKEIKRMIFLK
jgi:hypothetical protein